MIKRVLSQSIRSALGSGKALLIMGPRQVGKSTLLHAMFDNSHDVLWLEGDETDVRNLFANISATRLKTLIGNHKYLIIDEAQRIPDIGLRLKLITDQIRDVQVIATGSSSFELSAKLNESLTGRKRVYRMFPLTYSEMVNETNILEENRLIPHRLVYGYYPEVVTSGGNERQVLNELTDSYLYKDVLSLDSINKPDKLVTLLQALALQIGSQVSYNELSQTVGLDIKTIEKYINILEKCFIIFRLGSFARNLRNELKQSRKIYFYDNGIRNAILSNYAQVESRMPKELGALWENFIIAERIKRNSYKEHYCNQWFWRTQQQKEIDYIEEKDGKIAAFEFKWNPSAKYKYPTTFVNAYPESHFTVVTPENIDEFLL